MISSRPSNLDYTDADAGVEALICVPQDEEGFIWNFRSISTAAALADGNRGNGMSVRENATWHNGRKRLRGNTSSSPTATYVLRLPQSLPSAFFTQSPLPSLIPLSFSYCHALIHILIHGYRQHFRSCPTITITVTLFRRPYSLSPVDPHRQACSKISSCTYIRPRWYRTSKTVPLWFDT